MRRWQRSRERGKGPLLLSHRGHAPRVAESAYVAPNAVVCGDVTIGDDSRVLFGAVISAEGGPVEIGARCIVMEQAVIRGRMGFPTRIGDNVLIGPHAHVNGAAIERNAFIATNASVFPGARVGEDAVVRINGIVHIKTTLPAGAHVPIGWAAMGEPMRLLPPEDEAEFTRLIRELDFAKTVFGLARPAAGGSVMPEAMQRYAEWLGAHRDDEVVRGRHSSAP